MLNQLLESLRNTREENWEKAKTICNFAENIEQEFFAVLGIEQDDSDVYKTNRLVYDLGEDCVDDIAESPVYGLQLGSIDPLVRIQNPHGDFMLDLDIEFCPTRVLYRFVTTYEITWQKHLSKEWQVTTYEGAARLVAMHLAEQILRVMKTNPSIDSGEILRKIEEVIQK